MSRKMSAGRIIPLCVFYLTSFYQGVCLILVPSLSFLLKSPEGNGLTEHQYGLTYLPMIAAVLVTTVLFKGLYRKLGSAPLYYAGIVSNLFYLILLGCVSFGTGNPGLSFLFLVLCNIFLGAGFSLTISLLNILVVDCFPKKRDSVLTGLHASLGTGAALSPVLVEIFYSRGDWTGSILVSCLLFIGVLVLGVLTRSAHGFVPGMVVSEAVQAGSSRSSALPAGAVFFLLVIIVYGTAEATVGTWTTLYLYQIKSFTVKTATHALSMFWLFITIGRIFASLVTLKMDSRLLYRVSPVLMAASIFAVVRNLDEGRVLVLYMAVGFGCSYFFPLSLSLSTRYFDAFRERLASYGMAALMVGVGMGSALMGFLQHHGIIELEQAFYIAMICSGVIFIASWVLTWRKPESSPQGSATQ